MKLIVNGDDFGITHGCNLAIIDCFNKGSLTSTSLMINMPYAKEAAQLAKENPDLSVGVHLSLTVGKPLTNVPSLVDENGNLGKKGFVHPELINPREVEQEAVAQIEKFIELTGKLPDHINSHHGIEALPGGKEILQKLSKKYDRPIRAYLNAKPDEVYDVNYEVPGIVFPIEKDPNAPVELKKVLSHFTPEMILSDSVYELAGHPGYVDKDLIEMTSLTTGRVYDAANFISPELKKWIDENHVELISFRDLEKK